MFLFVRRIIYCGHTQITQGPLLENELKWYLIFLNVQICFTPAIYFYHHIHQNKQVLFSFLNDLFNFPEHYSRCKCVHNNPKCFQYVGFSNANILYTYYSCVKSLTILSYSNWMQQFRNQSILSVFTVKLCTFVVTFFVAKCSSHSLNMLQAVAPIGDDGICIS